MGALARWPYSLTVSAVKERAKAPKGLTHPKVVGAYLAVLSKSGEHY
jgi:hypothetical protein